MKPQSIRPLGSSFEIIWQDGHRSVFELNYLRRRCPCAVCRGNSDRTVDGGVKLPAYSRPLELKDTQAVGNYAIRFSFSDRHDTGIYSYEHLRRICPCSECAVQLKQGD